jgi:hypothetical protein
MEGYCVPEVRAEFVYIVAAFLLLRPGLDARPVHVRFVVDKVALEQVSSE